VVQLSPASMTPQILQDVADALRLDLETILPKVLQILAIWALAWVGQRVVKVVARRIVAAVDDGDDSVLTAREQRGQTIAQLLRSVGWVAILVTALLLTANVFIDITPILAGAGILGLAVSFGAQSLVKDVIAGFFILLENTMAVGDVVDVAGVAGSVERMTMRVVVLRDLRGVVHTVPNGQITVVSNRTRGWSRAVIEIGVAYQTDLDRALDVLRDEARRFGQDPAWRDRLDAEPEVSGVESLADSAVVIRTLIRTRPGKQWEAAREYRRRVKNRLDQEGIEIPFPQRTMHVRHPDTPHPPTS